MVGNWTTQTSLLSIHICVNVAHTWQQEIWGDLRIPVEFSLLTEVNWSGVQVISRKKCYKCTCLYFKFLGCGKIWWVFFFNYCFNILQTKKLTDYLKKKLWSDQSGMITLTVCCRSVFWKARSILVQSKTNQHFQSNGSGKSDTTPANWVFYDRNRLNSEANKASGCFLSVLLSNSQNYSGGLLELWGENRKIHHTKGTSSQLKQIYATLTLIKLDNWQQHFIHTPTPTIWNSFP